jgi:two-component system, OmpR family, phosphate regulon sensor histidine kinase PhoR
VDARANQELDDLSARVALLEQQLIEERTAREQALARVQTLELEQRFFQRLLAEVPTGLAYLDRDLIYRVCNVTNAGFLARTVDQVVGHHLHEVVPDNPAVWSLVEQVLETGEPYPIQNLPVLFSDRPFEGYHHFLLAYIPDIAKDGSVIGVFIVAQEITEMVRAQEAQRFLSEAGELLARSLDLNETLQTVLRLAVPYLADYAMADVYTDDGAFAVAAANDDPEMEALLYEIRRRYPFDPSDNAPWTKRLREHGPIMTADPRDELIDVFARDAEHAALLQRVGTRSSIFVPLIARDRMVGVLSLGISTSQRRYGAPDLELAEELARRCAMAILNAHLYQESQSAEARYSALFEGSADAIIVSDEKGQIIDANPAALDLLGYSREELLAVRGGSGQLVAGGSGFSLAELARLHADGFWRGEMEMRRKDGTVVPVDSVVRRIELPTDAVYMGTSRDISARRELERTQREFSAMVTHELKGPLTTIKGFAQLMQRRATYNERGMEAILQQTNQLERLINDMMDAARVDSGRLELVRDRVDLVELALVCCEQSQAATQQHLIRLEVPGEPIPGWWDRDRLAQVFTNLLSNAIKYAPDGGEIVVRVEDGGGQARVSIRDRGIGIPKEMQGRLFERFYRVSGQRASAQGLGLGLYITRSLVEAHGGTITVESEPGAGSTFTFTLPHTAPPE